MQNNKRKSTFFCKKLFNICTKLILIKAVQFERINPDPGSSFKVLYHNVMADVFKWNYHYHPEVELVFVFDGIGRRHVGNHVSYYENGDLVLIGSNLPHGGFGYGALAMHEEVVVQFPEEIIQNTTEFEAINDLLKKSRTGLCFGNEIRESLKDKFVKIKQSDGIARYFLLLEILKVLSETNDYFSLNERTFEKGTFTKDQQRGRRIFDFIKENYGRDINTAEVAEISNLTTPAFCNYFKKNFGVTFTDFLNQFRVNQACLLLTENQNISEVAFQCGFNSLSYFSRTFKQVKNLSPKEFQLRVSDGKK